MKKGVSKKKSMLVDHPFWDEVKLTKKDKADFKKKLGYIPTKMIVPNKKYYKFVNELLDDKKH